MTKYTVPFSNKGRGGFIILKGHKYHLPSWTKVESTTTFEDIMVEKNPFEELFKQEKVWVFESSNNNGSYEVRLGKNGPYCSCWGYRSHKKCKHVREVEKEI